VRRVVRFAAALGVLVIVLFLAGFPARTYLDQREALASTEKRIAVLKRSNKALEARRNELHSDAAVERLAREQYNLVRPNEEAYAILPGPEAPKPAAPKAVEKPDQGFFGSLLDKLTFWS
jgi:cell division protein FtsB